MAKDKKGNVKSKNGKGIPLIAIVLIIAVLAAVIIIANGRKNNNGVNVGEQSDNTQEQNTSYVEEIQTGVKINKSSKLNEAKQVDGLSISNIQLTTKDGMSTLLADVTNKTKSKSNLKMVEITLLDENNTELVTVKGIINELKPEESTVLNISMTSDYVNAYDFSVKVK